MHPLDSHGDADNLRLPRLQRAAAAAGLPIAEAAWNITRTLAVGGGGPAREIIESRPTLVFDVDGVLAFTAEAITGALNAMFTMDYSPVSQTFFPGTLVGSRLPAEQAAWISGLLREPSFLLTFAPDFHAFTTLNDTWEAGYPVQVVTEREPDCQAATAEWLATWGAPPMDVTAVGRGNKPAYLAARYSPEHQCVLIDDNPSLAITFAGPGREVWTPKRPYTPSVPRPHVDVFSSWQQARAWLGISPSI